MQDLMYAALHKEALINEKSKIPVVIDLNKLKDEIIPSDVDIDENEDGEQDDVEQMETELDVGDEVHQQYHRPYSINHPKSVQHRTKLRKNTKKVTPCEYLNAE